MLPGETLFTGASPVCKKCHTTVVIKVMHSDAGYYIGTECACSGTSPYTRETGYYRVKLEAEMALNRIENGDIRDLRR